jgi:hypothetical protein
VIDVKWDPSGIRRLKIPFRVLSWRHVCVICGLRLWPLTRAFHDDLDTFCSNPICLAEAR